MKQSLEFLRVKCVRVERTTGSHGLRCVNIYACQLTSFNLAEEKESHSLKRFTVLFWFREGFIEII